ncbi:MAG TPA: DNA replication/repair protein RecF [Actinomycetaceae bacterium]|nr:DNA replication/repair protein RecF [Actinomycetaceae bacterium]
MHISDLSLHNFRSYPELVLGLEPGPTAFIGPNGQGKTNIVEAIAYLGTFTSHRVASDSALVRAGEDAAVVRARAVRRERASLVELEIVAGRANRARLNRAAVRPRDLIGLIPSVMFAPEDLELVKGDPQVRRRFIDDLAVLLTPRLAGVRAEYDKLLRQRGALLKSAGAARRRGASFDLSTLDVWDGHVARAGAEITAARLRLLQRLRPFVAQAYEAISSGQSEAGIGYRSALLAHLGEEDEPIARGAVKAATTDGELALQDVESVREQLVAAMAELRNSEIDRGVNLVGPHRDDLLLSLGGLPARGYASHGESWSLALALRLASYDVLRSEEAHWHDHGDPILILDDVFAELDVRRRDRLVGLVADAEQLLITAAVGADVPQALDGRRMMVADGTVRPG